DTEAAAREDLARLDDAGVVRFFDHWVRRTLVEFARDSLKPTALAALSMASLERNLAQVLGPERARELTRDLVIGVRPGPEAALAGPVGRLAAGKLSREASLARFGHRGSSEMELPRPRWAEAPATLEQPGALPEGRGESLTAEERLKAESRLNAEQRAL